MREESTQAWRGAREERESVIQLPVYRVPQERRPSVGEIGGDQASEDTKTCGIVVSVILVKVGDQLLYQPCQLPPMLSLLSLSTSETTLYGD